MSEPVWVPLGASGYVPQGALVTALPSSPVDGQEIVLTDSLTAGTYYWRLRYVAARASDRWIFVGGSPLYAQTQPTGVREDVTSNTYVAGSVPGPQVTVPVSGLYEIAHGLEAEQSAGTAGSILMSYAIGATAAVDADATSAFSSAGTLPVTGSRVNQKAFVAGAVLAARYRVSPAGRNSNITKRWMSLRPIAVGG